VVCYFSADLGCILYSYFKTLRPAEFDTVAAVLRLSQKYFVQHLREQSLAHLEREWPSTLSDWDVRERQATDHTGQYAPRKHYTHPISVINLARELSLDHLLPAAFFDLCRYGPSKIAAGSSAQTSGSKDKGNGSNSAFPKRITEASRLSDIDLCAALRGRESAQRFIASFIDEHLANRGVAEACLNKDGSEDSSRECRESFYFIMLNVMRSVGGIACGRDADPLFTLLQAAEMLERTDFSDGVTTCGLKLCRACKEDFHLVVQHAREKVWDSIPRWFGLDASNQSLISKGGL
jgi:hypothetical protein